MIDFAALQQAVKAKLDEDRSIDIIDAEGENLEDAVRAAAHLLGIPIRHLEYEVIVQKSSFFGLGENICKIRAFERPEKRLEREEQELEENAAAELDDIDIIEDTDGEVFVQRRPMGIFIKVTEPEGSGHPAKFEDAVKVLSAIGINNYNSAIVKTALKNANGEYQRVADYAADQTKDAQVKVQVSDDEMFAYINVSPPEAGGCDFSYEDYIKILKNNSVIAGFEEDFLRSFSDRPIYNQRVCVAKGIKAINGTNAYLDYYFETDQSKIHFVESQSGRVNFKDLNIIQNVRKDEKLAEKNDATRGKSGITVTGRFLEAYDGTDITVTLGKNVRFGEDGRTILADINGQVVFANNKISVEMAFIVEGHVNLKTGNIIFLGNVIVNGNVEEGFSVKASGSVEVHGSVNKAEIRADGDIIVNHGISGREDITVHSGGTIWAKFIENANVEANSSVVVTDGIINSNILALRKVVCQGKRAAIIGGKIQAAEEINAKQIGSVTGNVETVCEVGYDPQKKHKLESLAVKKTELQAEFDEVQLNLQTLVNIKKQRGSLPEDKEAYMKELNEKRQTLAQEITEANTLYQQLEEELKSLQSMGSVSASAKIFPGVVVCIRDQKEIIRAEHKAVTFVLEGDMIRSSAYVETKAEDLKKKTPGKK